MSLDNSQARVLDQSLDTGVESGNDETRDSSTHAYGTDAESKTSFTISKARKQEKTIDEDTLEDESLPHSASLGGSSFDEVSQTSSQGYSAFGDLIEDRICIGPRDFAHKSVLQVVSDEIKGSFEDTVSAFDQVFNAFTLQENEIFAVVGEIDEGIKPIHS